MTKIISIVVEPINTESGPASPVDVDGIIYTYCETVQAVESAIPEPVI